MRRLWFIAALIVSALLAALHAWATAHFIYWQHIWFDLPMHFLGGLTTGVVLVAFFGKFSPRLFVAGVVVVAVGWEIFEYVFGLPRESNYALDTMIDLLMDTLGAVLAYVASRYSLWKRVD